LTIEQAYELAVRHHQAGRLREAEALYRQILAVRVEPNVLNNLGNALAELGQVEEAVAAFRQALAVRPDFVEACYNLGSVLQEAGRFDEAVAAYQDALKIRPDLPEAHVNLGNLLGDREKYTEAVEHYRRAIAIRPEMDTAHYNLGNALQKLGRLDEAVAAYRRTIELKPDFMLAYNFLGNALRVMGQLDEAIAVSRRAIELDPTAFGTHSKLVYMLLFHPDYDAKATYREHELWDRMHAEPLRRDLPPHQNDRDPDRRIRVGLVSADFMEHPVGRFILPLLANHDRLAFELVCYSDVRAPDVLTEEIRSLAELWRDVWELSDEKLAEQVRADKIDILVDLALHTRGHRLRAFARKPAPVQVSYLGYCGTTGVKTIDYRLTDRYLDPVGGDDSRYTENSIRLSGCYWCYQPRSEAPPVIAPPAVSRGFVTFGCLNEFSKVSKPALDCWAEILKQVPGSRLIMLAPEGSPRNRVRDELARYGIAPNRVEFIVRFRMQTYLEMYNSIDICLDPFPYTGATTTCDALWMGVPVVSLAGATATARGGLTILSHIGLGELVAQSREQYVELAVRLAANLPRLSELRSGMRERMLASPLMDAVGLTRDVESRLREMWRRWCDAGGGDSPVSGLTGW
jgi:predicted O-linked N-acetylglucosamine transferase (SPINDLY family)